MQANEIDEKKLKKYIDPKREGSNPVTIIARYRNNLFGGEWVLEIRISDEIYRLIEKRGNEKGFTDLNRLVSRLQKWGAKTLIIKL